MLKTKQLKRRQCPDCGRALQYNYQYGICEKIIEILETDFTQIKTTRITNAVVLCQYLYEGKEYKKEASIDGGCKKGDIIDIVIDADNPDVIINFTKQEKKVCFMTLIIPAIIASALVITLTILKRKIKQET